MSQVGSRFTKGLSRPYNLVIMSSVPNIGRLPSQSLTPGELLGQGHARPSQFDSEHVSAYAQLKKLFVHYRFLPGSPIHASKIAEELKVSTTPVREALNRLSAEGFVAARPGKGFFANILTLQEMIDLYELDCILLCHSLRLACVRNRGDHLLNRPQIVAPYVSAHYRSPHERGEAAATLVEDLFEQLACLSGNSVLISMVRNVGERTHYIRAIELESDARASEILQELQHLLSELYAHQSKLAILRMQSLFEAEKSRLEDLLKEGHGRVYAVFSHQS